MQQQDLQPINPNPIKVLTLKKLVPDDEADTRWAGKLLGEDAYDHLLQEDSDVIDEDDGEYLIRFRKHVLDPQSCRVAYQNLRSAASHTDNRGLAAGEIPADAKTIIRGGEVVAIGDRSRTRYRQAKPDGTLSNTNRAVTVQSGIIGFFDRNPRIPFCRQTSFNIQHGDRFAAALPFIQQVSEQFRLLMPHRWEAQKAAVDQTPADFVIPGTVFTTITVNKNWATAVHQDAGDLRAGFGVLCALRAGNFKGGYFTLPQWRVAVDMDNTDVLLVNVHVLHGNTPIKKVQPRAERVSCVFYFREKMKECGTAAEELERAKRRKLGDSMFR
jgi:hypothetical protein